MDWFFGLGSEKPGNIAALVIIVSFLMFAYVLVYVPDTQTLSKKDTLGIIGAFITGALGFLYGRSSSHGG